MVAQLLLKERHVLTAERFVEIRIWRVSEPVRGSTHDLKYALVHVVEGICVLRYDNEAGKGDHRHVGDVETDYLFTTGKQLLADFWRDVEGYQPR